MGGLFGGAKSPKLPAVAPVAPMPDPAATDAEKRKSMARKSLTSGRQSTFLTDVTTGGKLGG